MEQADVLGVPNFCWTWGRVLARGGQPPGIDHFKALREAGIGAVLSLRVDGEPSGYAAHVALDNSSAGALGAQSAYRAEDQRNWCHQAGLKFHQIPCPDLVAVSPWAVAEALEVIDLELQASRAVFVHCIAGIGRTGVIMSAWLMSRGLDADATAARFLQSFDAWCTAHEVSEEDRNRYFVSFGAAERWWTLHQVANALGCPITQSFGLQVPPRPEAAHDWERAYATRLRSWRERRQVTARGI
jgi:protein tyrosine phosphatase (PTP) superfamily phosphohydrolase (DUF442 family)